MGQLRRNARDHAAKQATAVVACVLTEVWPTIADSVDKLDDADPETLDRFLESIHSKLSNVLETYPSAEEAESQVEMRLRKRTLEMAKHRCLYVDLSDALVTVDPSDVSQREAHVAIEELTHALALSNVFMSIADMSNTELDTFVEMLAPHWPRQPGTGA